MDMIVIYIHKSCCKSIAIGLYKYWSLLQNILSFIGLFCKRHLCFKEPTKCSYPVYIQPIAVGLSFILNLESKSHWSLFDGTWQKRPRELDYRLRFEKEEMTLQMQQAVCI